MDRKDRLESQPPLAQLSMGEPVTPQRPSGARAGPSRWAGGAAWPGPNLCVSGCQSRSCHQHRPLQVRPGKRQPTQRPGSPGLGRGVIWAAQAGKRRLDSGRSAEQPANTVPAITKRLHMNIVMTGSSVKAEMGSAPFRSARQSRCGSDVEVTEGVKRSQPVVCAASSIILPGARPDLSRVGRGQARRRPGRSPGRWGVTPAARGEAATSPRRRRQPSEPVLPADNSPVAEASLAGAFNCSVQVGELSTDSQRFPTNRLPVGASQTLAEMQRCQPEFASGRSHNQGTGFSPGRTARPVSTGAAQRLSIGRVSSQRSWLQSAQNRLAGLRHRQ